MLTLQKKLGQRMAVGFEGTTVSENLRYLVRTYKIGNVILFRDNLENATQAKQLCSDIQQLIQEETGYPAFITIDQEGGMVTRLPNDMVNVPGAMALASSGEPALARQAAAITAAELRSVGINFNLAPVLDVNSNSKNPVIGVRSYGDTPETVISYASATIKGYNDSGVLCCGKHFPGHGDTNVDSHLALPEVAKTQKQLMACELAPFKAMIEKKIPAIMSSHILFPALEPQRIPATMSRTIITGLLKEQLGFSGLVLSDGMEMKAIREEYGTPHGCVEALAAGIDIVFVCHDFSSMEQSMIAISKAYEAGRYDVDEFDQSVESILQHKKHIEAETSSQKSIPARSSLAHNNAILMRRSLSLVGDTPLPALGNRPLFAGPLAYRSTIASAVPDSSVSFADWFADKFSSEGITLPVNPNSEDVEALLQQAKRSSSLILASYNGTLHPTQINLINLAISKVENILPVVVVALRNPYDLALITPTATRLAAFEYSHNSFIAIEEALRGEFTPTGKLSVEI